MNVLQQILVPQESVNDQYVTVVSIPFANGSVVKKDDVVIELETSKAVLTIEAEVGGYIEYFCALDEEVGINKLIVQITDIPADETAKIIIAPQNDTATTASLATKSVQEAANVFNGEFETIFSSKAEQIIAVNKVDKAKFLHLDFVTEEVVLNFLYPERSNSMPEGKPVPEKVVPKPAAKVTLANPESVTIKKIKPGKKREIEYLSSVQGTNLVSTIYIDIDLGSFFESVNPQLKYFKDSLLPIVTYEVSRLLIKYPVLNSFFFDGNVAQYKDINVGIAIDIDDGLKVVKIPNTNNKNIGNIEDELFDLSNKYLDKRLETEHLTDVTFTITDLSSQGSYFFTPLVNKDNAAILGIAKVDDKLNRVIISLSFDHRVTEGKIATLFLRELKERIESYSLMETTTADIVDKIRCYRCLKKLKDDLNNFGFVKVVNSKGEDKYICDSCLFNF